MNIKLILVCIITLNMLACDDDKKVVRRSSSHGLESTINNNNKIIQSRSNSLSDMSKWFGKLKKKKPKDIKIVEYKAKNIEITSEPKNNEESEKSSFYQQLRLSLWKTYDREHLSAMYSFLLAGYCKPKCIYSYFNKLENDQIKKGIAFIIREYNQTYHKLDNFFKDVDDKAQFFNIATGREHYKSEEDNNNFNTTQKDYLAFIGNVFQEIYINLYTPEVQVLFGMQKIRYSKKLKKYTFNQVKFIDGKLYLLSQSNEPDYATIAPDKKVCKDSI